MVLEGYALTHEGKVRSNNEDNYYLFGGYKSDPAEKHRKDKRKNSGDMALAAVFDGMGGEEAGELASLTAAESVKPSELAEISKTATNQLLSANEKVCCMMRERNVRMGTTAVQLYVENNKAVCVNLGDSRGYMFRSGMLTQLSKDHSEGQRMIDMGFAAEDDVRKKNSWHNLTQHVGIFPDEFLIEPYFSPEIDIHEGDVFLLCSDGLTDMLKDNEIQAVLIGTEKSSLDVMADKLLKKALGKGGIDNVTIVLLRAGE